MTVETVDESLNGWFIQVTDVGSGLSWFVTHHESLWVNEAECIYHDLAFYGLNRIDDNRDSARCKLLERLLCVDIDRR